MKRTKQKTRYAIDLPAAAMEVRDTDPLRLDYSGSWYGDPWVGAYAKVLMNLLGQHFANGGTVDEALMRRSARLCAQLRAAAARVGADATKGAVPIAKSPRVHTTHSNRSVPSQAERAVALDLS